jgi:hypothetical protein
LIDLISLLKYQQNEWLGKLDGSFIWYAHNFVFSLGMRVVPKVDQHAAVRIVVIIIQPTASVFQQSFQALLSMSTGS